MNNNLDTNSKNIEIGIIDLIQVIWSKKLWVIISTFLFTVLAGIYAFTAQEKWTSKSIVSLPKQTELGDYLVLRQEFNRILQSNPVDAKMLSELLFGNFSRLAQSIDVRNEFFINSDIYKKLSENKNEQEQRKLLFKLSSESTKFSIPDAKKEPNAIGRTIEFSAETPKEAKDTLNELIQFINAKSLNMDVEEFLLEFQNVLTGLQYEKSLIQENLSVNKAVQLENLNKAYQTAQKAGIKEYSKTFNDTDLSSVTAALSDTKIPLSDSKLAEGFYLFMLGEKYLKAQIDVANEKGIVYPPRYYQIDYQLKQLEPLFQKIRTVKAQSYHYQDAPDYPINRDWPKKLILLLVGAVLGAIIGVLAILVKTFFRKNDL